MKTKKEMNHRKRIVNLNMDAGLWHRARVRAAEKDTTLTTIVEHYLEEGLENCRHDKIPMITSS